MIYEPEIEIACDGIDRCSENVSVRPEWVYASRSPESGYYDCTDESIEEKLQSEHNWTVKDGKHYCEGCSEDEADG